MVLAIELLQQHAAGAAVLKLSKGLACQQLPQSLPNSKTLRV
jgi:hypothetical protein